MRPHSSAHISRRHPRPPDAARQHNAPPHAYVHAHARARDVSRSALHVCEAGVARRGSRRGSRRARGAKHARGNFRTPTHEQIPPDICAGPAPTAQEVRHLAAERGARRPLPRAPVCVRGRERRRGARCAEGTREEHGRRVRVLCGREWARAVSAGAFKGESKGINARAHR